MPTFNRVITKALNDYKKVIDRCLSSAAASEKLGALRLKYRNLRDMSDLGLYQKGLDVLADIEQQMGQCVELPSCYSHMDKFYQHFKDLMADYVIYRGGVVHGVQTAARSLVLAIQLLAFPEVKLTPAVARKIADCQAVLAQFGTEAQNNTFIDTLKKNKYRKLHFFLPFLEVVKK